MYKLQNTQTTKRPKYKRSQPQNDASLKITQAIKSPKFITSIRRTIFHWTKSIMCTSHKGYCLFLFDDICKILVVPDASIMETGDRTKTLVEFFVKESRISCCAGHQISRMLMSPSTSLKYILLYIFFSRCYTYFIIQYSSWLSSRAGPDLVEW